MKTKYRIVREPSLNTTHNGPKVTNWYYAERCALYFLFFRIWTYMSGTGSFSFDETKTRLDTIINADMSEEVMWQNYEEPTR